MNKDLLKLPSAGLTTFDAQWLKRRRQQLLKNKQLPPQELVKWQARLDSSLKRYQTRKSLIPESIDYPALPINEHRQKIIEHLQHHQVLVIAGETGSGKTTQIPKLCLEAGLGVKGRIGHTQPRRLAATTVAARISEELQCPLGALVGYQVRFKDQSHENTLIKLMTDGILLAEIQQDKYLNQYEVIIIDEAHERSLNIDFLLGLLKPLLKKRPELRLIITSATIDVGRFSSHFDDAPVLKIPGRSHPIETLYHPLMELNADKSADLSSGIVHALHLLLERERQGLGHEHGDVLVFLPGERDIRETALALRKAKLPHIEVLPLYARLTEEAQRRIFKPHSSRRVVLATNVAETSITVPGIRYVIDSGLARTSRYSYRSKVQRLPIEPISQAAANQRQGRCGRINSGTCLRLYDEQDFNLRTEFSQAEILRTNLASVVLTLLNMGITDIETFPFIDKPDARLIRDGYKLLHELAAIDDTNHLTPLGRKLAQLPIDPRLGRMILSASELGCLKEVLIISSGLAVQDPRERPSEKRAQADETHARFNKDASDFMSLIRLWDYFESLRQTLSRAQLQRRLKKEFLSLQRLKEWRDIHHQLLINTKYLQQSLSDNKAHSDTIHRALLSGLLSHMATKVEKREYLSARNRCVHLFPGSSLYKKPPPWIMAAELLETAKIYARTTAKIEPDWALNHAAHLVKYHYSEPAWSSRTGHVMAKRKTTLYGLTLIDKQRVSYSRIEPEMCRELFIRQAFAQGTYSQCLKNTPPFWAHNLQCLKDIEALEAKSRRHDILVDEQALFEFFSSRIPNDINNLASFEKWRQQVEKTEPNRLCFNKNDLMRHRASHITEAQFPEELSHQGTRFPISYHFAPGAINDGVTVALPLGLLPQLPNNLFDALVPGLLNEKCVALLKLLPKSVRKQLVPLPDFVADCLQGLSLDAKSLHEHLNQAIKQRTGESLSLEQWQALPLDDYYRMNFQVIDEKGLCIDQGRELSTLKKRLQGQLDGLFNATQKTQKSEDTHHTVWDFGELFTEKKITQGSTDLSAYTALIAHPESVSVRLVESVNKAHSLSREGLIRLLELTLQKDINRLKKTLFSGNQASLILRSFSKEPGFVQHLIKKCLEETFLKDPLPHDKAHFERRIAQHKKALHLTAHAYQDLLLNLFSQRQVLLHDMKSFKQLSFLHAIADIKEQLAYLFYPQFLDTPFSRLKDYPRYLKAIEKRLEKLNHNPKEEALCKQFKALYVRLLKALDNDISRLHLKPELIHYRWLLEEYRVSVFAQTLKTSEPVSLKRLQLAWP